MLINNILISLLCDISMTFKRYEKTLYSARSFFIFINISNSGIVVNYKLHINNFNITYANHKNSLCVLMFISFWIYIISVSLIDKEIIALSRTC